jgi:hypothetical protein
METREDVRVDVDEAEKADKQTDKPTGTFKLTYGEKCFDAPKVKSAHFEVFGMPSLGLAHMVVQMKVCNDQRKADMECGLTLPLSNSDATVVEFCLDSTKAVAVSKAKAAEISYKEQEAGRNVATVASLAAQTWQTTIYPLPYEEDVLVTIRIVSPLDHRGILHLPLTFPVALDVSVKAICCSGDACALGHCNEKERTVADSRLCCHAERTAMPDGMTVCFTAGPQPLLPPSPPPRPPATATATAAAFEATSNGEVPLVVKGAVAVAPRRGENVVYFGAHIPCSVVQRAFQSASSALPSLNGRVYDDAPLAATTRDPAQGLRLAVVVDMSHSRKSRRADDIDCIEKLAAAMREATKRPEQLTVYALTRRIEKLTKADVEASEAIGAVMAAAYAGGTNLALLTDFLRDAHGCGVAGVVLLSDGASNLLSAERPDLSSNDLPPVHVPCPPGSGGDLHVLRWIAAQTGGHFGTSHHGGGGGDNASTFAQTVVGARSSTVLVRVATDLKADEAAWMESAFQTVPDFRLTAHDVQPARNGGFAVSGCWPAHNGFTPPKQFQLTFHCGGVEAEVCVTVPPLSSGETAAAATKASTCAGAGETCCNFTEALHQSEVLRVNHALLEMEQAQRSHWDSDVGKSIASDIACREGIASEHTTLLMLKQAEQFADHDIPCPDTHSQHARWKEEIAKRTKQSEQRQANDLALAADKMTNVIKPLVARFDEMVAWRPFGDVLNEPRKVRRLLEDCDASANQANQRLDDEADEADKANDADETDEANEANEHPEIQPDEPNYRGLFNEEPSNPLDDIIDHKPALAPRQLYDATAGAQAEVELSRTMAAEYKSVREAYTRGGPAGVRWYAACHLPDDASWLPSQTTELIEQLRGACPDVDSALCADLLFEVLERNLPSFQVCRVVAYHLLELGRMYDAVAVLELVRNTLAPGQPHSFTDLALARIHLVRGGGGGEDGAPLAILRLAIDDLAHVVVHPKWQDRFVEIEWPVLLLLSWTVAWAERMHGADLWPEDRLPASQYRLGGKKGPQLDLFVWLGWDTDYTDIDLHVSEPTGTQVFYSNKISATTGAMLSKDMTAGFGPEVYTLPNAPTGTYKIFATYYASHQHTRAKSATSAVVWTITQMGTAEEAIEFHTHRLTAHEQKTVVHRVRL